MADSEGYISLPHIFNNSMKQFQKHINIKDLYNALKDSSLVELNDDYFIKRMVQRKSYRTFNAENISANSEE